MAKMTEERVREAFAPLLQEGETLTHFALGVKQPPIVLIVLLIMLAILPGVIATALLTKNYCIGLTDRRLIVLQIASLANLKMKSVTEYSLEELRGMQVSSTTGSLFTHIAIESADRPFKAKFHRALAPFNRPNAMAIGDAVTAKAA